MNKIDLQFSIEEIILIKECLLDSLRKSERRMSEQYGKSNCYNLLTKKQIDTANALLKQLDPYGYGM